ncbi:P-loop containing nucleoside triphosphate hydrolase protein [Cladochytrium replicatum]|nr:P-loop containing nucleoside triphosphate hydrolase protein [Cladochytrium replicatum]
MPKGTTEKENIDIAGMDVLPLAEKRNEIPRRQDTNVYQRWSFAYVNPLLRHGKRGELDESHFPLIEDQDQASLLANDILREWDVERKKHGDNAKLWRSTARVFGFRYALAGAAYFAETIAKIAEAVVLGYLLKYFQNPAASASDGYILSAIMSVCVILHAILHHVEFFLSMRTGMQLRIGFISAMYQKCLSLSISHTSSTGVIVNLVSNDVQRFEDAAPFAHFIWLGPVEVILCFIFMYMNIGLSAIPGALAPVLLIPLQSAFARQFGKLRKLTVKARDSRIRSVSDTLAGMTIVKLYAWEEAFIDTILGKREEELKSLGRTNLLKAINEATFFASSAVFSLCAFIPYYFSGGEFTPARIFTTITLISVLRLTMASFFGKALQFTSESYVSLQRIQEFLSLPEISQQIDESAETAIMNSTADPDAMIVMHDATFGWLKQPSAIAATEKQKAEEAEEAAAGEKLLNGDSPSHPEHDSSSSNVTTILKNITFVARRGEILGVCGPVGSGKTSVIQAILGEMLRESGQIGVRRTVFDASDDLDTKPRKSRISYTSQTAWIAQGTIRDNILFGQPYEDEWFWEVVRACALDRDFERFPERENTMIGERGITLSGGQRARLALARATYCRPDIVLLDDPLSAVDYKVGRHIFERCIVNLLAKKCRSAVLLITHQLQFLSVCSRMLVIEDGRVSARGTFSEITSTPGSPIAASLPNSQPTSTDFLTSWVSPEAHFVSVLRDFAQRDASESETEDNAKSRTGPVQEKDKAKASDTVEDEVIPEDDEDSPRELVKEEAIKGVVTLRAYSDYFSQGAGLVVGIVLGVALVVGEAALVVTDWWLARWTQAPTEADKRLPLYPAVFSGLVAVTVVVAMGRAILFFEVCLRSGRKLFTAMLNAVILSPMSFFLNPHGRLMNRFSKDVGLTDEMLPLTFFDFTQCTFMVIGVLVVTVVVIPYVLIVVPIIFLIFFFLRRHFVATSRQVKRIEAITRSPVYAAIPSTLEGLSLIRAFGAEQRFTNRFVGTQDKNTAIWFMYLSISRWLGFRLDVMSAGFLIIVAFASVVLRESLGLGPGVVGLLLSYTLQLIGLLQWCVRQSAEVENLMTSVERILEYTRLPPEEPKTKPVVTPPEDWPSKGQIKFSDMSLTYPSKPAGAADPRALNWWIKFPKKKADEVPTEADDENLPPKPALRNISIELKGGLKIGLVGRTGAGKSSFLQALFRMVEPQPEGSIEIDGIATSSISVTQLRRRIAIIPQESFLFFQTLRFNLDPLSDHDDSELWQALEVVELKRKVDALPEKLDTMVAENGGNFSQGERQLICLARAILKRSRVLVLDEATSSIDLHTDTLVQAAVRGRTSGLFADATVICIAHRLFTIIDFDLIVVLDDGAVVEVGAPWELLRKDTKDGWFRRMVEEAGQEASESLKKIAFDAEKKSSDVPSSSEA